MIRKGSRVLASASLFGAAVAVFALPALAQKVDFAGKRLEITVPGREGSGNDVYARVFAPFFEKHLPGKPTIIVRNIPGSGTIAGANQYQNRAKPDGMNMIAVTSSTISNYTLKDPRVKYKLETWIPIILSPQGSVFYVSPSLGVKTAADLPMLKGKKLVYGGNSPTSADLRITYSLGMLGILPTTHVWGADRGPSRLAFERGEFNSNYDTTPAFLQNAKHLVREGKAIPMFALGVVDKNGNVVRDPNFPDLPSFYEAYLKMNDGKKPSGPAFEAWKNLIQIGVMANKFFALPAGTPKNIVETYRTAARNILKDPEFIKTGAEIVGGYEQVIGDDALPIIAEATSISPEAWNWLDGWLQKNYDLPLVQKPKEAKKGEKKG
ncbi:MAG: tricarboxylate transporter [Alphaproteobacteria bacterium]|nr:tricarboxylate transporter [Alphaproteobacteria bacterium]